MTSRNRIHLMSCVFLLVAMAAVASPESFYQSYLPAGIAMDMSPEQVRNTRPQAITSQSSQPSAAKADPTFVEMVEIAPQGNTRVAYWYRFKAGKLGAVTRSIMTARMPIEHAQAGASKVAEELKADFALKGQEQVVRSTGTENTVLTAQLWEDKADGLNIYFVTTNREITVVMFDPKAFGKADFFLGPERMKDLNAQAEVVRSLTDKTAATPIPIVDLLPKVTGTSATPAPAATPVPSTPAPSMAPTALQPTSTPAEKTPMPIVERKSPTWPWLVGIGALIVIVAFASKRRG